MVGVSFSLFQFFSSSSKGKYRNLGLTHKIPTFEIQKQSRDDSIKSLIRI